MHKYYIQVEDDQQGPFTIEELKEKKITKHTMVWRDGLDEWMKAEWVDELKPILYTAPPPVKKTSSRSPARKPKSTRRRKSTSNARLLVLLSMGVILLAAWLSNPTLEQHQTAASNIINQKLDQLKAEIKPKKKGWKIVKDIAFALSSGYLQDQIRNKISREDYGVCSLTKVTINNRHVTIGIGAFGNVWLFTESIDTLDPDDLIK